MWRCSEGGISSSTGIQSHLNEHGRGTDPEQSVKRGEYAAVKTQNHFSNRDKECDDALACARADRSLWIGDHEEDE
jgi:hypothetical protein